MLFQWWVCDFVSKDEKVLLTFSVLNCQGFKPHFQLDKNASVYGLGIDTVMQMTSEDDSLL